MMAHPSHPCAANSTDDAQPMKVLIVDDDVFSRMMLMHLIAGCGRFDILEAEDGLDAWQQLDGGLLPAMLFCDVRMPRLSGFELLHRMKCDAKLCKVPFVLVSTANEQHAEAMASGVAGYIIKPFQNDQVRVALRALQGLAGKLQGVQRT